MENIYKAIELTLLLGIFLQRNSVAQSIKSNYYKRLRDKRERQRELEYEQTTQSTS